MPNGWLDPLDTVTEQNENNPLQDKIRQTRDRRDGIQPVNPMHYHGLQCASVSGNIEHVLPIAPTALPEPSQMHPDRYWADTGQIQPVLLSFSCQMCSEPRCISLVSQDSALYGWAPRHWYGDGSAMKGCR